MAVKAIENITTTVSSPSHHLLSLGICSTLWYLFTHSSGGAVKVAAASVSWNTNEWFTSLHTCRFFMPNMLIASSVMWHCKWMRRRQCADVLWSVCLRVSSLYLGWSGWSQHSSCRWLTLVALRLSQRAWVELGPRSSSTCSQCWQRPCSPHATTCNDSPRRFCVDLCLQRQTQINIRNQHIQWHSVIYVILVLFF